ncbi:outer membrane usher protein FimD/PapC [Providencia alcalifaciens]|nr:outer membrane usher protein FimD/PapC [Providencia alcalifaciens]
MDIKIAYSNEFFNREFLSDNTNEVADLSRFDKGLGQSAGQYRVEVYLNDEYIGTQDVTFINVPTESKIKNVSDDTGLIPCLSVEWFKNQSINVNDVVFFDNSECVNFYSTFDKSLSKFDFESQKLYLNIPQVAFLNNVRGYISPSEWQSGINALLLNYSLTGSSSKNTSSNEKYNNYFLNLQTGLNLGSWRFKNDSTWNYTSSKRTTNSNWNNIRTYAQKAIILLKSQLTIGDSFTEGDIFDSVGFRGVMLASDDNMLPDSMRGFAPTVRGVANSNAQVTIRQNGYVIYQTYVAPGAFEIKDLYSTSSSGNLDVTVSENNGTVNQFTVPYSAVPILQREGRIKYEVTAAKYRSGSSLQTEPDFWQGTLSCGLPESVTVYGGSQLSDNYRSFAIGVGKNLSGNLDVTVSENNGTVNQFTVPYSAVPILQREGRIKYEVTAAKYRSGSSLQTEPDFWQGTLSCGLPESVTVYGGSQLSDNYRSFAIGVGKNLGVWGAISTDITHANSRLPNGEHKDGQSIRFLYAKSLNQLGTNFQLMGYRYSTAGYYTLSETSYREMSGYVLKTQDGPIETKPEIFDYHNLYYTKKGRFQANISQQIEGYGSIYISANHQTYWGTDETDQSLQLGFNGNWEDITYGIIGRKINQ